jgi:catechol 2,3-dioxygenase-like lactoylglutathione lyase family enzyme
LLDHISLQVTDVAAAAEFYLRVFAPVGMREALRFDHDGAPAIGLCGPDGHPRFWLGPADGPVDREVHLAFTAPTRAAVDGVHEAAVAAGAEILARPQAVAGVPPGLLRRVPS